MLFTSILESSPNAVSMLVAIGCSGSFENILSSSLIEKPCDINFVPDVSAATRSEIDEVAERALKHDMSSFEYEGFIEAVESVMFQLKVMPFNEAALPDNMESL